METFEPVVGAAEAVANAKSIILQRVWIQDDVARLIFPYE